MAPLTKLGVKGVESKATNRERTLAAVESPPAVRYPIEAKIEFVEFKIAAPAEETIGNPLGPLADPVCVAKLNVTAALLIAASPSSIKKLRDLIFIYNDVIFNDVMFNDQRVE